MDTRTYLIDLGREAADGLECGSWESGCVGAYGSKPGAAVQSCDGIHPLGGTKDRARHGELGSMLAVQAALALAGVPRPPPPPTPPAPTPPACEAQCIKEGHCCSGRISSYQHPSCAMGCAIARHTSNLEECQSAQMSMARATGRLRVSRWTNARLVQAVAMLPMVFRNAWMGVPMNLHPGWCDIGAAAARD